MADELLLISRPLPGCVTLTLNRPAAMNALSMALRRLIVSTLDALATDASVRVLILTGAGKAFCAGLDLREISGLRLEDNPPESDPVAAVARFPVPVIGAINGVAITGGLELALACDILLAAADARFADTHARIGVIPGWGLSQRLSRLIGIARAKEMGFSGNFVSAEQAERWGLVNRVVAADQLMQQALALAADITTTVEPMVRHYKRLIDNGHATTFADGMRLEAEASQRWSASLSPTDIAQRREDVIARGQQQQQAPRSL
jgi:enoyl-CoA hydratase